MIGRILNGDGLTKRISRPDKRTDLTRRGQGKHDETGEQRRDELEVNGTPAHRINTQTWVQQPRTHNYKDAPQVQNRPTDRAHRWGHLPRASADRKVDAAGSRIPRQRMHGHDIQQGSKSCTHSPRHQPSPFATKYFTAHTQWSCHGRGYILRQTQDLKKTTKDEKRRVKGDTSRNDTTSLDRTREVTTGHDTRGQDATRQKKDRT